MALLQTAVNNTSGANATIVATFGTNITPGSMITICGVTVTTTISSVADGPGDTFTAVASSPLTASATSVHFGMWYALNSIGGSKTCTINTNAANGGQYIIAQEWSEILTASALDTSNSTLSVSGAAITTPSINTAKAYELIIAMWGINGNTGSFTVPASWYTYNGFQANATGGAVAVEAQLSNTGSFAGAGTISSSFLCGGIIAAFETTKTAFVLNNFQQPSVLDNGNGTMSVTEKIR